MRRVRCAQIFVSAVLLATAPDQSLRAAVSRVFNIQSLKPVAEFIVTFTSVPGSHIIELRNFAAEANPVVYLLNGSMTQIASAIPANGQVKLTAPGNLSGIHLIVVRSKTASVLQTAELWIDGQLRGTAVFTTGDMFRLDNLSTSEKMMGVRPPLGPFDHIAYLIGQNGEKILKRSAGTRTSVSPPSTQGLLAVFAARNPLATGPLRAYRNDVGQDSDSDGLGNELEAQLGTCASKTGSVAGANCNELADARDTDGDGLQDGWEVLGRDYKYQEGNTTVSGHLTLPNWGSNPRHKDIFIEVDFRRLNFLENMNNATAHMPAEAARDLASIYGDAATTDPVIKAVHAVSVNNPDRLPGISLHLDTGVPPETPGDATIYGNWGGYNPVDAVPDPNITGWDPSRHVRLVGDITNDGSADIVAFGEDGLRTALATGDGKFVAEVFTFGMYGVAQAWDPSRHVRLLADINNDDMVDIVAFGDDGVWTSLATGTGFSSFHYVLEGFGFNQGWRVDKHVRLLADINNDGMADIVGFGDAGVQTALATGDGGFGSGKFLAGFSYDQAWRVDKHVRLLADINNDGMADIVGFGDAGVQTALATGDGGFGSGQFLPGFSYDQAWRVDKHVRLLADINNDDMADIVGFGDAGVQTALATGDGSFGSGKFFPDFGYDQAWRVEKHDRLLADINNDSMADIIGFGDAGVWTALSTGDGGFGSQQFALDGFGSHKYGPQNPTLVWHQQMNRGRHGVFHYVMGYETGGGSCTPGHIACGWNFNSANGSAHEFGHTIGLDHNGPYSVTDEPNCKPNYPSLMNYAYYDVGYAQFSDGRNFPNFNNHSLQESNAVDPSNGPLLTALEIYFGYKVDHTAGSIDWNRNGQFAAANERIRAYANSKPGGSCEFTRQGMQTTGLKSTRSPAIVRFNNTIWAFAINTNGQLAYTYAVPAFNCSPANIDHCPDAQFPPGLTRDLGPLEAIDAKTMIINGQEMIILVGIRPDGTLLETYLKLEAGLQVWGAVFSIDGTLASGEPSLANNFDKTALALAYKGRDNIVRLRFRSAQGWSPEQELRAGNKTIAVHPNSSPAIAYTALPVGITQGERLIGAFVDADGYIQLYTPQLPGSVWARISIPYENMYAPQGRPVMAWTGGPGGLVIGGGNSTAQPATYGRFYILYRHYQPPAAIYHSPTDPVRWAMSYVDRFSGKLRIGLVSDFDNTWSYAYGMSLLTPSDNGALRAAITSAVLPNHGTIPLDEVFFRPHADGISDLVYNNYDDWRTLAHDTCTVLVPHQSNSPVHCVAPW